MRNSSSDQPDENQFGPTCNLAVLTKARRKVVGHGINQLCDHDKGSKSLLSPERGLMTCGSKHAVAITSHPSAFQDPMMHVLDVGEAGSVDQIYPSGGPDYCCCSTLPILGGWFNHN